jgi:hypothetical protein
VVAYMHCYKHMAELVICPELYIGSSLFVMQR